MRAAQRAFATWRFTPLAERVRLARRAAALIEERVYEIAAALALEVGKNRMEALGEAQETADFFAGYASELERNAGYDHALPDDPLPGFRSRNRSVLKPYGVWGVITPFNFPLALAGGPVAAALVTGNTVVLKGATDTPWAGRLLADCIRDAGYPPGVFNYVTGRGSVAGEALVAHEHLAGLTFTGSYDVGMGLLRRMTGGAWPRPCIAEMGGKNACVVTARADLERAAVGHRPLRVRPQRAEVLRALAALRGGERRGRAPRAARGARAGDPDRRPVPARELDGAGHQRERPRRATSATARGSWRTAAASSRAGSRLREGDLAHGHFVAPTLAEAPRTHPLFREEMFQPILMLARVKDVREAVALANDVPLGLTAGCYGGEDDVRYFLDHIEAGVTYVNRPQGATTGAWPFYQPFGGWKGSGSTGKAIGSFHYLPLYLREQSQTVVE